MFNPCDMFSLTGRTAIVTGGATGLGLAVTRCLAGAGARVAVMARSEPAKTAAALAEFGDRARYYQFEVTNTDAAPGMIERVTADLGPVDILVNNAGNHLKKPIGETSVEEYRHVLDVHLVASFAMAKSAIPGMRERGRGSIIFMASMSSFIGLPQVSGYASAKAGYLGLVRTLASECGGDGVRVNAIAPGWMDTPMYRNVVENDPPRRVKILARIPMGKEGDPMDIGMAALYLASDAAGYVNGVCLPVDGGGLIGF